MPSITAGAASNFGSYTLYLDWSENTQPGSNTSTISWNAYLRKNAAGDTSWNLNNSTRFYVEINGVVRVDFNGGYDFRSPNNFVGATRGIGSGTTEAIGHASNGTGSTTGRILMSGPGPITGGDSGYQTIGFTDFDRTPTTPTFTSGSRNSTGTSFSTTSWSGSVNNNGPGPTWTLQRSTVSNFSSDVVDVQSTTSSGTVLTSSSLDPNTTYYYRLRASNSDTSNTGAHPNPKYSSVITSFGVPGPPTGLTVTPSTTAESRVNVSWVAPTNTQGTLSRYDLFVDDVFVESVTPPTVSLNSIKVNSGGTAFTAGTSYNFRVVAKNATNLSETNINNLTSSRTANISAVAPGKPYKPATEPTISNIGLDMTIVSAAVSGDGGVAINTGNANQGYFVQYQLADTLNGTYGYNGVPGAWSPAVKMTDQATRSHTYSSMTPAKYYKFRVYAANTVIYASNGSTQIYYPHNNITYTADFATNAAGYFLPAGGKRFDGSVWIPTQTAKRFDGTNWVPLTIAKRFDGSNWVPLS